METVKEYLDKLEINNSILAKLLKEVYINRVVYFREERVVYFYLTSKEVVSYELLDSFREELKVKLDYFKDIKLKIRYIGFDRKSNKDIIKRYWPNIIYILKSLCPSIAGWYKQVEYLCLDDLLKIKLPKGLFYERLVKQNVVHVLKNILIEEVGMDIKIEIERAVDEEVNLDKIIKRTERITEEKIKELELNNTNKEENDEEEAYVIKPEVDENLIYGENVHALVEKIKDLNSTSGTVSVVGEVFDIETKELRNGKILMIASITDYTSSISCKLFLNDLNKDIVLDNIKKGSYLKIKGDIIYDTYQRELTMTISGIRKEIKQERVDTSEIKRVELHAHTQMSSMDAVCPTKKLVERAAKWGHKAIAITDHGVVQAFPDAMNAAKAHGIKVLYGVEGYLVEDDALIIEDANNKPLTQSFVVFDIETTGFSNTNDKITEIGAVKIENFKVVDKFSELINPQKDISYKIQELTGITNDMVADKPTIEEVLPKFIEFIGDSVLVAHNAEFDMGFIAEKCRKQNIKFKVADKPTIEEVLPKFIEFIGDSVLVAHNAEFDMGFIAEKCRKQNIKFNNKSVDTLTLARVLLPELKRHRLNIVAKALGVQLLNHHRAVDDAQATALIYIKFLEMLEKKGATTLSDRLNIVAKALGVQLLNHHRAVDDAQATALIYIKFLEMLEKKGATTLSDVNEILGKIDYQKLATNHVTLIAKNYTGLKNLYKIISDSHVNHFYRSPRILRSVLQEHRDGILVGSACESGVIYRAVKKNLPDEEIEKLIEMYDYIEIMPIDNNRRDGILVGSACESGVIYRAVKKNLPDEEIEKLIEMYDYIEIMPIDNNRFMIEKGEVNDEEELRDINRKLIDIAEEIEKLIEMYDYIEIMPIDNNRFMIEKGEVNDEEELRDINRKLIDIAYKFGKIPVATGDVHFLEKHEAVLRKILKYSQGFKVDEEETYLHFRTTDEMLKEFSYLGDELAYEVVVENSNKIADMVEVIKPIPDETYPPVIEGSDTELREMCNISTSN